MNALMKKNDFWGIFFPDFFETFSMELDKLNYDYPKVNTFEDDNNFRVDVFYPGMKKEMIDYMIITIKNFFEQK